MNQTLTNNKTYHRRSGHLVAYLRASTATCRTAPTFQPPLPGVRAGRRALAYRRAPRAQLTEPRDPIPESKASQFCFEPDKFSASGLKFFLSVDFSSPHRGPPSTSPVRVDDRCRSPIGEGGFWVEARVARRCCAEDLIDGSNQSTSARMATTSSHLSQILCAG